MALPTKQTPSASLAILGFVAALTFAVVAAWPRLRWLLVADRGDLSRSPAGLPDPSGVPADRWNLLGENRERQAKRDELQLGLVDEERLVGSVDPASYGFEVMYTLDGLQDANGADQTRRGLTQWGPLPPRGPQAPGRIPVDRRLRRSGSGPSRRHVGDVVRSLHAQGPQAFPVDERAGRSDRPRPQPRLPHLSPPRAEAGPVDGLMTAGLVGLGSAGRGAPTRPSGTPPWSRRGGRPPSAGTRGRRAARRPSGWSCCRTR